MHQKKYKINIDNRAHRKAFKDFKFQQKRILYFNFRKSILDRIILLYILQIYILNNAILCIYVFVSILKRLALSVRFFFKYIVYKWSYGWNQEYTNYHTYGSTILLLINYIVEIKFIFCLCGKNLMVHQMINYLFYLTPVLGVNPNTKDLFISIIKYI